MGNFVDCNLQLLLFTNVMFAKNQKREFPSLFNRKTQMLN